MNNPNNSNPSDPPRDQVHDPFEQLNEKPTKGSSADAFSMAAGGLVFGALFGVGAAAALSLSFLIAGGVGAAIGMLVGWMMASPNSSGTA